MKSRRCILIFYIFSLLNSFLANSAYASDTNTHITAVSSTNGLILGIVVSNRAESPIDLEFRSPADMHSVFYLPKEAYLARMELFDSSNHLVPQNNEGKKYGQAFDRIYWNVEKFASRPHGPCTASADRWTWAVSLPPVSETFAIVRSGEYRLRMEIQVMLLYLNTSGKQVRQIVRFPAAEIQLIK